jgi:hypothetical protein
MTSSVLLAPPDRVERHDVLVMQQTTVDDLSHIQRVWPSFERLVGLKGRKMFALVDTRRSTYTVCTPVRPDDRPEGLGLDVGTMAGGWYLRGRLAGEPPEVYATIGPGMSELEATQLRDEARPLVEFYRRRNQIELWLPIRS